LSAVCDLILLYSNATDICKQKSATDAGVYLTSNKPKFNPQNPALKLAVDSLDLILTEYKSIMDFDVPLKTRLARAVESRFAARPKTKGVCFVDYKQDTGEIMERVTIIVPQSRPVVLPKEYFALSKLAKNPDDLEIIEAFSNDQSRLILTQLEMEKFLDLSFLDLPKCNFIARLQVQSTDLTIRLDEGQAALTVVHTPQLKTVQELWSALRNRLLMRALPKMPSKGGPFKRQMDEIVRLSVRTHARRKNELKRVRFRRKPVSRKIPQIYDITIKCKKCRTHVCFGNELFTLFVDGCRNYVVPEERFQARFTIKRFHTTRKVPKQINRLQKMYCLNCSLEWGHICYFPKRGLQLPVLRAKNFLFDVRGDVKTFKMWSDATFWVPSLGACLMNLDSHE